MSSPKIGSNESGYLSLNNGESNVLSGSSKASSIWGDKSLWNLSNSPNSTSSTGCSMQTGNGSLCNSESKDLFWHSSTSSPISSSSHYNNLNSLWSCSPIKEDDSLGSIWNIPKYAQEMNFEAPLPPPISYTQKSQTQLIRPQDIGGTTWSGMNNNNNSNNSNNSNAQKIKDQVGPLWSHPTPPNLPLTLQAQNYNVLHSSNSKFKSPMKQMEAVTLPNGFNNNNINNNNNFPQNNININNATSTNNMQLFSDEFLSYLNMIN